MSSKHRTQPQCQSCSRPTTDHAYLCPSCGEKIARYLGDIPALIVDVTVTYTRQARGDTITGHAANTALPWSEAASTALAGLRDVLTGWVTTLTVQHDARSPGTNPTLMASWLLGHVDWIRRHPNALQAIDALADATSEMLYVMDLHVERWYAGTCRAEYDTTTTTTAGDDDAVTDVDPDACCIAELYVKPGAAAHSCRNCATVHDIAVRRDWLLKAAEDQLAHAELIGRALASMGAAVTPEMIRNYAARGRIVAHSTDRNGRPQYRVGDVVEVVRQIAVEKSKRAEKRATGDARRAKLSA